MGKSDLPAPLRGRWHCQPRRARGALPAIRRRPRSAEGGPGHGTRRRLSSGVPAPGEWSAHEVVVHCADSETNGAARIRYLTAEADPVIVGYDEAKWARHFDYHDHPLDVGPLPRDCRVRANTTALIRRMPENAWQRVGRHTESGRHAAEDWPRDLRRALRRSTRARSRPTWPPGARQEAPLLERPHLRVPASEVRL